ncbi:MAG: NAD(P)-dependent oxidoreductase [Caldiserica bacterium]|jgi:nucleoside-diphosphate-sugar epimerase|nr:NAD(P)-dependent oxidoreductase [Caldisericota bacterium]MDH7562183.1 NAD(P)-dependent oxidoreductase [Caldisericota bacterium]
MGKKVLMLGGAGFIGSYVARELLENGFNITIVDNFSKYGFIEHDFFAHPNCEVKIKDVRAMYPSEFRGYDWVLCFAALIGGVKYFHQFPYQIARDNTEILTYAIDSTLGASPHATFVYFSSSMVFEHATQPVREEDLSQQKVPFTNYGMQKLFGEYLVKGAGEEFGLNYLIVRPFNAVGSGELPGINKNGEVEFGMAHVIPDFAFKALIRQSPFEILGDGEQVRTFTHGKDIGIAVRMMLEREIKNKDFNICGEDSIKMSDLARLVWEKANPGIPFPGFKYLSAPPADVRFRVGSSSKAKELLGWTPTYNLEAIIDDVISFIQKNMSSLGGKP